jgi:lysozyme
MRQINQEGLNLIKQWEGLRLEAYLCPAKVWTIGYGHTATAKKGMSISEAEAVNLLRGDLARFQRCVENAVTVPLNDNQFAALVSFCFNVGEGAFKGSTLLKKLNAGNYDAVSSELARWNKVGKSVSTGLTNRRAAEAGLWVKGSFVSSNYIEPSAPSDGKGSAVAAYGGIAAAAATAAPALQALSGVPMWVGVAVIAAITVIAAIVLLRKK